jgi:arsenite-transporting ATPase
VADGGEAGGGWVMARPSASARRVLLMTGKGGTGKTTLAASTAVRLADLGARTLVLSTDAAHSLSDVLGCRIGSQPTSVTTSLHAQEVDAKELMHESWSTVRDYLQDLLVWSGADRLRAEELAVVPGIEELLALRTIAGHLDGAWDAIVVDCAPTAETVRLLALPSTLRYYVDRVLPTHRRLARRVAPALRRTSSLPPAPVGVVDAALQLADELGRLHDVLTHPAMASVRLVATPESMVVSETRRVWSYLSLFDYRVDSLIVNRVVPSDPDRATDPWLARMREAQRPHLAAIDDVFAGLGRATAPIHPGELVGLDRLRVLATEVYGDHDPRVWPGPVATTAAATEPMIIPEDRLVTVALPGVDHDEVDLVRTGEILLVTLGPYRRSIVLPAHLHSREAVGARMANGRLEVEFAEP